MAPTYGQATLSEKLGVIPVLFRALFNLSLGAVQSPFLGSSGAPTLLKQCLYDMIRTGLSNLNGIQLQFINWTDEKAYQTLAKKRNFRPDTTVMPDGVVKAHWIGPRKSPKVFLFFHGGGYTISGAPEHYEYLYRLQQDVTAQGHDFAIVLLDYTLAPQAIYPTQLQQAAEYFQHLTQVEGKDPANIIIGGDSAGANLTLSFISHLLHPHPSGIPAIKLHAPLRGAVLISPWTTFNCTQPSFTANARSDILSREILEKFGRLFLGSGSGAGLKGDNYNEPAGAPRSWWAGIEGVVRDIVVWGGGSEVLVDSIRQIAGMLESVHGGTTTIISPGSGHDELILDLMLAYPQSETSKALDGWVASKL